LLLHSVVRVITHGRVKKIVTGRGTNSGADFELRLRPVPALRRAAAAILAAVLLLNDAAYAHSGADCRPVPCDELVETRNGIMWRGAVLFNDAQVKPSPDQLCHVCAKEQTGTLFPYLLLCAFIQPSS